MVHTISKKLLSDRILWPALVALIVVALIVVAFLAHRNTNTRSTATQPSTTTKKTITTKGSGDTTTKPSTDSSSGPTNTTTPTLPSVKPNAPFGSFISNPTPGQNGAPLEEASVCNTSPNVRCDITFTKGGVTKDLGAKTTDDTGAAYWSSWTPQSVGLASGNWTVTAIATSGDKSTSTTSHTQLQVQQ